MKYLKKYKLFESKLDEIYEFLGNKTYSYIEENRFHLVGGLEDLEIDDEIEKIKNILDRYLLSSITGIKISGYERSLRLLVDP